MLVEGDTFKFAPSQGGLTKAVQGVVDQFVAMMNTIPRIEGELGKGAAGGARLLAVANVEEEMVMLAKQRLQVLVEKNFALTAQQRVHSGHDGGPRCCVKALNALTGPRLATTGS